MGRWANWCPRADSSWQLSPRSTILRSYRPKCSDHNLSGSHCTHCMSLWPWNKSAHNFHKVNHQSVCTASTGREEEWGENGGYFGIGSFYGCIRKRLNWLSLLKNAMLCQCSKRNVEFLPLQNKLVQSFDNRFLCGCISCLPTLLTAQDGPKLTGSPVTTGPPPNT